MFYSIWSFISQEDCPVDTFIIFNLLNNCRVFRLATISSCIAPYPTAIALRYLQRKMIMTDPNWHEGHYYDKDVYPLDGMRIAREIATLTYRSGPEWLERFGLRRFNDNIQLAPTFEIESYLQYQGVSFAKKYDPNSLLYISRVRQLILYASHCVLYLGYGFIQFS